ncbi:hypothetical protein YASMINEVIRUS_639 [Yasminevirus sp. GU-2018]|uniref:Uncharacterized protein n=1 Tax=Yasminevirus sp. GU-2018 TaxID=2420051 RepID=A0A5K0UAR0_9VIRU|nr:hypothetical protein YASMINEVIRUS_639 [Yasminevirus sp. GU-2018]
MNTNSSDSKKSPIKKVKKNKASNASQSPQRSLIKGYLQKHWGGYNFPHATYESSMRAISNDILIKNVVSELTVDDVFSIVTSFLHEKQRGTDHYHYFDFVRNRY